MISEELLKKITDIVGPKHLITGRDDLLEYGCDATKLAAMPDAVVFPANSEEVSGILSSVSSRGLAGTARCRLSIQALHAADEGKLGHTQSRNRLTEAIGFR